MVVVANRLPFDIEKHDDGTTTTQQSPGGLVTALEPILSRRAGAWIGWSGTADHDLEPVLADQLTLEPVPLSAAEVHDYYEGFSNATLWPLYHDAVAELGVPPGLVGALRRGQSAVRRPGRRGGRPRRDRLGARLPAAARPGDAAPAARRRPHRLLPAHPVPAGRAVQPAAVAHPDHQGPARRRPDRLPAARRRAQLRPAGPQPGRRDRQGHAAVLRGPHRPGRRVPDLDRLLGAGRPGRGARGAGAGPAAAGRARATRGGSSSASTGSTTPRASTSGCRPSPSCWPRRTRPSRAP